MKSTRKSKEGTKTKKAEVIINPLEFVIESSTSRIINESIDSTNIILDKIVQSRRVVSGDIKDLGDILKGSTYWWGYCAGVSTVLVAVIILAIIL